MHSLNSVCRLWCLTWERRQVQGLNRCGVWGTPGQQAGGRRMGKPTGVEDPIATLPALGPMEHPCRCQGSLCLGTGLSFTWCPQPHPAAIWGQPRSGIYGCILQVSVTGGPAAECASSLPPAMGQDVRQNCPSMGATTPHLVLARRHRTTINRGARPHHPCDFFTHLVILSTRWWHPMLEATLISSAFCGG